MAAADETQLRELVQDLVRETVADYLNSGEGKGLLLKILMELDEGHWVLVESEEGADHD